ncbi:hypothetical protein Micbo1qcDRAFT_202657 [Microdochium bolleyi]|uniref:Uncharacterized protein n=1 Tax=Microdochium bolleyi TaxID=196109 RepID=A0A136JCI7_9PEZI|nr:hypothetical protein Micbo1qcDRAFT_202657 [Microdochium bolleyi]
MSDYDFVTMHKPWFIHWALSDASSMTLAPPALGACVTLQLPTWVPGDAVSTLLAQAPPCGNDIQKPWYKNEYILIPVIALPLSIAGLAGCCTWWCWLPRRDKRRDRAKQERRDARQLAAG